MTPCGPPATAFFFVFLAAAGFGVPSEAAQDPDVNQSSINQLPGQQPPVSIKQIMGKECKAGYSPHCLKLSLIWLIGRSGSFNFPVLPGVSINSPGLPDSPNQQLTSNFLDEPEKVDEILLERLSDYLGTLSINVKFMDKNSPMSFAKTVLGEDPTSAGTARQRNRFGGAMGAAALMTGGSMVALGMAALAAMSGKALLLAMMALLLSAISALKGGGGGSEKTTYEIVAKPVISHLSTHSSEVQHGHGGHYRRSMDLMDAQPVVYSAHIPVAGR